MSLKSSQARFPWHYFEDPTESASEEVVTWIYEEFSGWAYQGFLDEGRGLLIGPFLTGENEELVDTREYLNRQRDGDESDLTVVYVGIDSPGFESTLPDLFLRQRLVAAAQKYDPTRECLILLLSNNMPHVARIVGSASRIDARTNTAMVH